jgi:hypothetical protein
MNLDELSSDDTALILKFRQMIDENGGSMTHDLNDPEQRAFVKLMHNVCGNNEEDFPGLHAMLDSPEPADAAQDDMSLGDVAGWTTSFGVPEVGYVPASLIASAKGYGTVVNGFQTCNLSVLVMAPNGAFLANGSSAGQAPLNSLAVVTNDGSAKQFVSGSTAMMTYSYKPLSGPGVSNTVNGAAPGAVADPTVIEPKRENGNTNPYNPNAICIGLGRPNDLTRCDYIFNEPTQNNPIGRLPLVGNVTFTNPIKPLQPGTNFLIDIFVIRTDQGGKSTQLDATDMNNVYANFNINPGNSNQLRWNLPMQANAVPPPPAQSYNPVVFSNIPWATEMVSYLTVNITVTVDDGSPNGKPVVVTIQSSGGSDSDPIDGVTYIMPIEFVWHCLGENAIVSVTHNGHHFQEVYVLETECGKTLTASAEHVIFTADGGVPARDLAAGMQLVTVGGQTALKAVAQEPGGGRNLWNLSLGEAPQIDETDPDVGQFYANGILVGDARATRAIRHRQINDIDWVKAHVPESFHKDVESTFRLRGRVLMR